MLAAVLALLIGLAAPGGQRALASVTLDYFRAHWQANLETAVIEWKTATELNTLGFIVERSTSPSGNFVAITDMIPAVGDQLAGWTYDPVADDPVNLTLGVTYWYRLVVINSNAPNDYIPPIAVLAGNENTVTPTATTTRTPTATRTATTAPSGGGATSTSTATATATATRTRTPTSTATLSPVIGPSLTPSATSNVPLGATVTPKPALPAGVTPAATTVNSAVVRTATPRPLPSVVASPIVAEAAQATATPVTLAQVTLPPTGVPPTLVPTNSTIVAIAPIVVADEPTPQTADASGASPSFLVLIGAAGVLLLGGLYAILRQTGK